MPKLVEKKVQFVQIKDGPEITEDPVNRRIIALFDALRKRGVGPEKAAYVVASTKGLMPAEGHPLTERATANS